MNVMTAVETAGRFTRADLEAMPDDGRRYELLDGSIIVTPAPGKRHQRVERRLVRLLEDRAPEHLEVFAAPLDVELPNGDVVEPDVLVITRDDPDARTVTEVPLLIVETLSPGTRRRDVGDKLTAYRDAGVPSYWVVDPINPRLQAWELRDDQYVAIADVSGDEEWTAEQPFPLTIRPVDLTR
jgi:Uma2 family endonuclease